MYFQWQPLVVLWRVPLKGNETHPLPEEQELVPTDEIPEEWRRKKEKKKKRPKQTESVTTTDEVAEELKLGPLGPAVLAEVAGRTIQAVARQPKAGNLADALPTLEPVGADPIPSVTLEPMQPVQPAQPAAPPPAASMAEGIHSRASGRSLPPPPTTTRDSVLRSIPPPPCRPSLSVA